MPVSLFSQPRPTTPSFGQAALGLPTAKLRHRAPQDAFILRPRFGSIRRVMIPAQTELDETKSRFQALLDGFQPGNVQNRADVLAFFTQAKALVGELGEKLGFRKETPTPRMVMADAYTAASEHYISQDARDFSGYHIAFRRDLTPWMKDLGLQPQDARYVFFGLQQVMKDLLHNPVTREEIDEAERFFKTAKGGKPFQWNRAVWDKVLTECNGFIPIKIEALRDGATAFPGEPIIQITAKDGFGELAAWFETKILQVWATSERATLMRHWLEYNKELVRRCTQEPLTDEQVTAKAQMLLADFSDRSSMNAQESEILGLASLTSFPTTATLSAAYRAYKEAGENPASNASMYSLAHRVVQGYLKEEGAYLALFDFAQNDIASYVADCYNFRNAVTKHLVPLAKRAQETGGIICARPDSGDPAEEVLFVLKEAVKAGLYKDVIARDGTPLKAMTNLRVIQADGMNFKSMQAINERLIAEGFSPPDCVYYGVGGFLHDALGRSNTSAAQKLCAVGEEQRPVMKSPLGAKGKESIPGLVKVVRTEDGQPSVRQLDEPGENQLVTWYDGMDDGPGIVYNEDFRQVKGRVLSEFKQFPRPDVLLSPAIETTQEALRQQYQKVSGAQAAS